MTTATAEKTITTNDSTYGTITIAKEDRYNLRFRWPCGDTFTVNKAKLALALKSLKELPKSPRSAKYLVQVPIFKGSFPKESAPIFAAAERAKVYIYSPYYEGATTLPIKDLEKALEL